MRARGAKVTDIAVLVVAADDGVMPQTIEALNHAQAADVPIVVAVNKVDKEGAEPGQDPPAAHRVQPGGRGVRRRHDVRRRLRASSGTGIDGLLEAVLLTADAALDLPANPDKDARGVAIEAHLDRGRGPVATVLVQCGTLRVGDSIVAGHAFGRVRAMLDEHGAPIAEAGPSRPVQVLGLTSVPGAGDTFLVAPARTASPGRSPRSARPSSAPRSLAKARKRVSLEDLTKMLEQGKVETLNLILKGDVSGSVEALEDALLKIDVGDAGRPADHPPRRRRDHRERRQPGRPSTTRSSSASTSGPAGQGRRAGRARGHRRPLLLGHLRGDRRGRGGAQGHAQARVRGGAARHRRDPRGLPVLASSATSPAALVRSGEIRRNAKARLVRDGVVVGGQPRRSGRCGGSRTTPPRSARASSAVSASARSTTSRSTTSIETFEMREKPRG